MSCFKGKSDIVALYESGNKNIGLGLRATRSSLISEQCQPEKVATPTKLAQEQFVESANSFYDI